MSRLLPALLVLVIALTSIGLGHARGTVRIGDEVVLCTGERLVMARLPGDPARTHVHLCPDMALSLMAALDLPPVVPVARVALPQVLPERAGIVLRPDATRQVRVRDPPEMPVAIL